METSERRRWPRHEVQLPIRIIRRGVLAASGQSLNIGEGGVCMDAAGRVLLQVGDVVWVRVAGDVTGSGDREAQVKRIEKIADMTRIALGFLRVPEPLQGSPMPQAMGDGLACGPPA